EARRGNPRVWLVAHIDSKSQTMPMLIRIASSAGLVVATFFTGLMLVLALAGVDSVASLWPAVETAAIVAALPSISCFVRNTSQGALDNATGVVAVLLAAQSRDAPDALGVLVTSAEELGVSGARAWAASAPAEIQV